MIEVMLFSYLRDEIGQTSVQIERDEMRVEEIKKFIVDTYKITALASVMVAVNEEYAADATIVKAGDKVALIPPVSGG